MKAVLSFFSFNGRATRSQWWGWILMPFLFFGVFVIFLFVLLLVVNPIENPWVSWVVSAVGWTGMLLVIIKPLAMTVRRLHDIGVSGWLMLIAFVPAVGLLILLILCGFKRGEQGDNKYDKNFKRTAFTDRTPKGFRLG